MLNVKRPPSSDLCHGRKDLQRGSSLLPEIRRKFFKSARGRRKYAILKADSVAVSTLRGIALPQGLDDGVLVVGAGIAGLAIAKALQKLEVPTLVLERDAGLRSSGTAISLWPNAFRALQALDCAGALDSSDNLDRMQICTANGKVLIDIPIPSAQEFKGIRRGALLGALASGLQEGTLRFGCPVTSVTQDSSGVEVEVEGGERVRARALVGADGVTSVVASYLDLAAPTYAGYIGYRGVGRFEDGLPRDLVPKGLVRQIWGAGQRAGIYPIDDKEAYWFVCDNRPQSDPPVRDPEECRADALRVIKGWAWGVEAVVGASPLNTISRARITDRWMAPGSRVGKGSVTLAGDSFHPMTPNLGQGGCTALEDAVVLGRFLREALEHNGAGTRKGRGLASLSVDDVAATLRRYELEREQRVYPLQVRSYAYGAALQLPFLPVVAARNLVAPLVFRPKEFLSHTEYNCGTVI